MSFEHWLGVQEPRRAGMTTALAFAAKSIDGVIVTANHEQALRVVREFRVPAVGCNFGINERGRVRPHFWEPDAVRVLLSDALNEVSRLRQQLLLACQDVAQLREQIEKLSAPKKKRASRSKR